MKRYLLLTEVFILAGGTLFSWSNVAGQVENFIATYGTIFRFRDCAVPNPLTTACFLGALALLAAFVWSLILVQSYSVRGQRRLGRLLFAGTIFAGGVFGYEFLEYYRIFSFESVQVSCSPGVHPLQTPCFYGLIFFLTAYTVSLLLSRRNETDL